MITYDLIIVGAGPAGMSAAVYAGRCKLKTLVIGEMPGGMAAEASRICNFLSYKEISGLELTKRMEEQVESLGVEIKHERVKEVAKKKDFEVKTNSGVYSGKKLILAMGLEKRKLGLKDEEKFLGRGISYCATCEAPLFKDKTVGVVGGGNAALTAALLLSEYAKKVYIFYRRENFFRAEPAWVEQVEKNKKIECWFKTEVGELEGKEKLEGVKLSSGKEIKLEGLFIEVGEVPNTEIAKGLGVELEGNFIKTDKEQRTKVKGIFGAGDITNGPLKQIITAAAEGAIAATSAYKELKGEKE